MSDDANNMTWFERHVVDSLERLEDNQKQYLTDFQAHTAADNKAFEAIRTDIATSKAAHDAVAGTKAKMWAAIATGISLISSAAIHFLGHHK